MLAHAGGTAQTLALGLIEGGASLRVLAYGTGSWLLASGATVSAWVGITLSYSSFSSGGTPAITSVTVGPDLHAFGALLFAPGSVSVPAGYPSTGYLVDADGVTYRSTFAITRSSGTNFARGYASGFTVPVATYGRVFQVSTITALFGIFGTRTLVPQLTAFFSFTQVAGTVGSYTADLVFTAALIASPIVLPI
ncbi:MAG: hypothetical protein QXD60_02470 [Nanopusillaceae archaeon]